MQSRYRFTAAWLPDGWHRNVVVSVDPEGEIVDISADDTVTTARPINGFAIPGMPNIHSHAFQRAMAGLAEQRSGQDDSFWTWRELMYRLAGRLTSEQVQAIATHLYIEMLKGGYTSVAEFHYLHHQPGGAPYANLAEMAERIAAAAETSGIGLTLLPAWITPRQGRSLKRSHRPRAMMVMRDDGPNLASVVTSMPAQPATCQPTSVTTIRLGPGAAWPRANSAEKSAAVIQPCTSTTWRCDFGQDGVAAAEGQHRQLRKDDGQGDQGLHHRRCLQTSRMLSGVSTAMVGSSGMRSTRWR